MTPYVILILGAVCLPVKGHNKGNIFIFKCLQVSESRPPLFGANVRGLNSEVVLIMQQLYNYYTRTSGV